MSKSSGIKRRRLIAGSAAIGLARPWVARADANTVKIGMQSIFSGAIALLGSSSRNAATMEVERINAAGGLAGRPIEMVIRD
jgi:branched-chain amino acid transport system substrate-binding protein